VRRSFDPGNLASVKHGAFSRRLTGPLAEQIAAEQLEREDCPLWLRDPSYAPDELDQLAGDDPADASLTEVTETGEIPRWGR
jgi:hypothetical protein